MKAAHTVLYMKKHSQTYASYPAMDIKLYERGVDLEVEGVSYIEMHRGPAAYVLGPPPSRGTRTSTGERRDAEKLEMPNFLEDIRY